MPFTWDNKSYTISSNNYYKLLSDGQGNTQQGDLIKYEDKKEFNPPAIEVLSENSSQIELNIILFNQVGLNTKLYLYKNNVLFDIQNVTGTITFTLQKSNFNDKDIFSARIYNNFKLSKASNLLEINKSSESNTVYSKFQFNNLFQNDDDLVLDYLDNLLIKCKEDGIFPKFINNQSEDFESIVASLIKVFSYYIVFSKNLSEFNNNQQYLLDYLKLNDVKINNSNTNLVNKISQTLIYQFSLRGTKFPLLKKYTFDSIEFTGEIFRLLLLNINDEFICEFHDYNDVGWFLDKSSPLYRGIKTNSFQKIEKQNGEKLKSDIDSLNYFSYIGLPSLFTDLDKKTLKISKLNSIGQRPQDFNNSLINTHLIPISNDLDYSFKFSIKSLNLNGSTLSVGFLGFNELGVYIENSFRNEKLNNYSQFLIDSQLLNTKNDYYNFEFYIFNKYKKSNYFSKYSALILEEAVKFVLPFFYVSENGVDDYFLLHNISLKPIFTNNTRSYINNKKFVSIFCSNKINNIDKNEIINKLIPYDSTLLLNNQLFDNNAICSDTFTSFQNWEETDEIKCVQGIKYKKYINSNFCLGFVYEKYEKIHPQETCSNCLDFENDVISKVIEYSTLSSPFMRLGKKYKTKVTKTIKNGSCGSFVEISYLDEFKENCSNRDTEKKLIEVTSPVCKNYCIVKTYKTEISYNDYQKCNVLLYKTYFENDIQECQIKLGIIKRFTVSGGNSIFEKVKIIIGIEI
jgi:hypothetical protein